jgi:hypothetical protein
MKNNFPVKVYSDPSYEDAVRADLLKAKILLNKVVNSWTDLDVGPLDDLQTLINNCEGEYSKAVNRNVEVPVMPGKYQISKDVWLKNLSIPVPNSLYVACRESRKITHCQNRELWQLVDGKIEMAQDVANSLIDANSIYARTPEQLTFCEHVLKYVEASNVISEKLFLFGGRPCELQFYAEKPFSIVQKSFPGPYFMELIPSQLNQILQNPHYFPLL